jgi:cytochrome c553
MGCHGTAGLGNAENPPLAGKDAKQLVQQMRDYKSGARQHLLMNQMMKPLSEQDIENLAAYYASLKAK